MRSSPSEALDPAGLMPVAESSDALEIRQRSLIKRLLPQSMFGRSLLLIVVPLVLVQIISTWVFYARHWETVSRRLASDVAGDIGMLVQSMPFADNELELSQLLENSSGLTGISFSFARNGAALPEPAPPGWSIFEDQLRIAMAERVARPHRIDALTDARDIRIQVQLDDGVLTADVPRKRLYTSTTYVFIFWMIGSSLVLVSVAAVFLRNQVRSLRRLAAAAEGFGKGRAVHFAKIEGALEVRQAGAAFMQMRDRIQRQIRQRTEMLAGVSHDLRTPLTRMKLAVELLDDDVATGLKSDIVDMQRLIDLYLDFARGEGTEIPVETDIGLLIEDLAAASRRDGTPLAVEQPDELIVPVRPNALRRCLSNLIANARRYGKHVWLSTVTVEDGVDIVIDDDGPGIPVNERDRVFQPFVRLDASRNSATGGVGLGLTIARDVARSHGGDVRLEASPRGGLRARVHLPG